jgi:hypothetical protein
MTTPAVTAPHPVAFRPSRPSASTRRPSRSIARSRTRMVSPRSSTRSLLDQGKVTEKQQAADRAAALTAKSQTQPVRLFVAITVGRIRAARAAPQPLLARSGALKPRARRREGRGGLDSNSKRGWRSGRSRCARVVPLRGGSVSRISSGTQRPKGSSSSLERQRRPPPLVRRYDPEITG